MILRILQNTAFLLRSVFTMAFACLSEQMSEIVQRLKHFNHFEDSIIQRVVNLPCSADMEEWLIRADMFSRTGQFSDFDIYSNHNKTFFRSLIPVLELHDSSGKMDFTINSVFFNASDMDNTVLCPNIINARENFEVLLNHFQADEEVMDIVASDEVSQLETLSEETEVAIIREFHSLESFDETNSKDQTDEVSSDNVSLDDRVPSFQQEQTEPDDAVNFVFDIRANSSELDSLDKDYANLKRKEVGKSCTSPIAVANTFEEMQGLKKMRTVETFNVIESSPVVATCI